MHSRESKSSLQSVEATANMLIAPSSMPKQGFHWKQALFESFVFLSIEQAYVVKEDSRWVVTENGVPFSHYWRDYKQSLSTWAHSGWDDGDPALYSYLGHPIQGALTSYIQIQSLPGRRFIRYGGDDSTSG